jgi:hypothetical protein
MEDTTARLRGEFEALVQPLVGLAVALPWKGYGSAIFLEIGQLSPLQSKEHRYNEGEACIAVTWDWRVESGSSVLYGSSNSGPRIDDGIRSLTNTKIHALSLV